jgi:hypothetical protein
MSEDWYRLPKSELEKVHRYLSEADHRMFVSSCSILVSIAVFSILNVIFVLTVKIESKNLGIVWCVVLFVLSILSLIIAHKKRSKGYFFEKRKKQLENIVHDAKVRFEIEEIEKEINF